MSGFAPFFGPDGDPVQNLRHLALPVIALAMPEMATLARLVRASVVATLYSDYVRTARAKGLAEPVIVLRHAMRNAALPILPASV